MGSVPSKGAGGGEFPQFMPHHILTDIYRNMLSAIMNRNGMAHHLGENCGTAGPGLYHLFFPFLIHPFDLFKQPGFNIGALL